MDIRWQPAPKSAAHATVPWLPKYSGATPYMFDNLHTDFFWSLHKAVACRILGNTMSCIGHEEIPSSHDRTRYAPSNATPCPLDVGMLTSHSVGKVIHRRALEGQNLVLRVGERALESIGGAEPSPESWRKSVQGVLSSVYRTHHRTCECASFYLFVSNGACYVKTRKDCVQGNQKSQESSNSQPCQVCEC